MLFSRPVFLFLFLPLVLLCAQLPALRARNTVLLIASLVFYAWGEELMVALMLLSIGLNYGFGLWIGRRGESGGRRMVVFAVVVNIGLLVLFKYADWLWESLSWGLVQGGLQHGPLPPLGSFVTSPELRAILLDPDGSIRLPIGISFFTFHALSYVIDVWRGDAPLQKNAGDFGLYIALFPQLIAGPIVRYRDVADQLVERTVTFVGFTYGIRRFVLGLGKKLLVADVCARAADQIFGLPADQLSCSGSWLGIACYTLQIYFDFSGYSDMAIGLGHLFGFHFKENFRHPYVSRSVTEFWRRWHISLSSWFRDYLYIPLGGNRGTRLRTSVNLVTVFFLCGMWHGAAWGFIVWGLYHGAFLVLERAGLGALLERLPRPARHAYTLLVVLVGWVFFRAPTLGYALDYLAAMAGLGTGDPAWWPASLLLDPELALALVCGVIGSTPWVASAAARVSAAGFPPAWRRAVHLGSAACLLVIFWLSVLYSSAGTYSPFIYFRF